MIKKHCLSYKSVLHVYFCYRYNFSDVIMLSLRGAASLAEKICFIKTQGPKNIIAFGFLSFSCHSVLQNIMNPVIVFVVLGNNCNLALYDLS